MKVNASTFKIEFNLFALNFTKFTFIDIQISMNSGYIAVLDSGIGGISVLSELVKNCNRERFIYLGDNKNAPYGNRTKYDLMRLAMKNVDQIKRYEIKALVLACNTLSVNLLREIREYSGVTVFGIFPPIERCAMSGKRILLLATESTAENYRQINLSNVDVVGLKHLVKDIEQNAHNLDRLNVIDSILKGYTGKLRFSRGYYDTIILGCTHYFFVKNKILDHFRPQKIESGNKFTIFNVENFLQNNKSSVKQKENNMLFIGESAESNRLFFENSGQKT